MAFNLKLNQIGPLISPEGAESNANYVIRIKEKREPETPPLEDVKERIKGKVRQNKMSELAEGSMNQYRKTIMEKMESGLSFRKAAKSAGLEAKESEYITRLDYIKDVGPSTDIKEVFGYEVGEISTVLSTQRASCFVKLIDFKPIEEEKFEEAKEELRERLTGLKKSQFLNKWLTDLKQKAHLKSNL